MTAIRVTVAELPSLVGRALGPSPWRIVSQDEVDRYADLTDDHNPIHVDAAAAAAGPYGTTIVHGFFTLGLLVPLIASLLEVTGSSLGLNYGLQKARFPAPVPVGSRIRARAVVEAVEPVVSDGFQLQIAAIVEVEGAAKPACAAAMLLRYYR